MSVQADMSRRIVHERSVTLSVKKLGNRGQTDKRRFLRILRCSADRVGCGTHCPLTQWNFHEPAVQCLDGRPGRFQSTGNNFIIGNRLKRKFFFVAATTMRSVTFCCLRGTCTRHRRPRRCRSGGGNPTVLSAGTNVSGRQELGQTTCIVSGVTLQTVR